MSFYSAAQSKLGRCRRCMGQSLALALVGWAATAGALLLGVGAARYAILAVAVSATALFAAHMAAYALRALAEDGQPCAGCGRPVAENSALMSRRRFVRIAGAVGAAGVVSVLHLPGMRPASAQGAKPCADKKDTKVVKYCKQPGESDAQGHDNAVAEAVKWAEARAKELCEKQACERGSAKQCVMADYHLTLSNEQCNRADAQCPLGSCVVTAEVTAICRCMGTQCASNNLAPPVEVTVAIVFGGNGGVTKAEACKLAEQEARNIANEIGTRICAKQTCPPPAEVPCRLNKVDVHVTLKIVGDACEATARITKVHCKC